MHPLLQRQLAILCAAEADNGSAGLQRAADAAYHAFDEQLAELRRQLDTARAQLRQADKMAALGQVAAGVAHEINNPLGYICSNFDTLQEYVALLHTAAGCDAGIAAVLQDMPQLLAESREGMARVRQIVCDLKQYSHGGDGQQWGWADLHQGMDATLNIVAHEVRYCADIVREYGALPPVWCLPGQLNQIVMNLVINAAQAISGARGTITLRSGVQDGDVWFSVSDTGCGIAADHLPRLFDPFFTTKPAGTGTGLGLSLTRDIVQHHGGRIEVHTEASKGSTFRVILPLHADGGQVAA